METDTLCRVINKMYLLGFQRRAENVQQSAGSDRNFNYFIKDEMKSSSKMIRAELFSETENHSKWEVN